MGGDIVAESEPGVGSSFTFTIRVEECSMTSPRDARVASLRGRRVLIIDDSDTNRRILRSQLSRWGMKATTAASGQEALSILETDEDFDVAIVDYQMPVMDGYELAARMQRQGVSFPLALLSSIGGMRLTEQGGDKPRFAAVLTKPVRSERLHSTLVEVLGMGSSPDGSGPAKESGSFDREFATRHPLRILLAEDNTVNQKVGMMMLSRLGYRADLAQNGLEAIEAVERQPYDLILMDLQMPEVDGFEATRSILARTAEASAPRIVAMTANASMEDRDRCLEAGMDAYLSKPFRVEEPPRGARGTAPTPDAHIGPAPSA